MQAKPIMNQSGCYVKNPALCVKKMLIKNKKNTCEIVYVSRY